MNGDVLGMIMDANRRQKAIDEAVLNEVTPFGRKEIVGLADFGVELKQIFECFPGLVDRICDEFRRIMAVGTT